MITTVPPLSLRLDFAKRAEERVGSNLLVGMTLQETDHVLSECILCSGGKMEDGRQIQYLQSKASFGYPKYAGSFDDQMIQDIRSHP